MMSLTSAFDDLQAEVNVKDRNDRKARDRRDVFKAAFNPQAREDVERVFASGSLARGSQIDPIHDVDMVVVFDATHHVGWGEAGPSAEEALETVRGQVHELLHHEDGSYAKEVRRVDVKNHSLKCFLDEPDADNAFTVDLVPALVKGDHLLIPEVKSKTWIDSDPEYLIREVGASHDQWARFVPLVRVLKRWNKDHGGHLKSLVIEVLALDHLREDSRPQALHRFLTAARQRIYDPVVDPAGHCGVIQPDLDRAAAYDAFDAAESWAYKAILAEDRGDIERALCCWREVFGDIFPEPEGGCPDGGTSDSITPVSPAIIPPRKIVDAPQG